MPFVILLKEVELDSWTSRMTIMDCKTREELVPDSEV
jgi:hypothetical protein